jgi:hypothetical protein
VFGTYCRLGAPVWSTDREVIRASRQLLSAAARYEHGLLDGSLGNLPVGSFSQSGTNVNTCTLTLRRTPHPS